MQNSCRNAMKRMIEAQYVFSTSERRISSGSVCEHFYHYLAISCAELQRYLEGCIVDRELRLTAECNSCKESTSHLKYTRYYIPTRCRSLPHITSSRLSRTDCDMASSSSPLHCNFRYFYFKSSLEHSHGTFLK